MGRLFGYWTVIGEEAPNSAGKKVIVAKCRCGTIRSVLAQNLLSKKSTSCGCYQKEYAKQWMTDLHKQRNIA